MIPTRRAARALTLLGAGIAVLAALAACGGAKPSAGAAAPSSSSAPNSGGAAGTRQPGTFGVIAAVSPGTLEVQDPSTGQTTVTYSATTTFTLQKVVAQTAVTSGECVSATAATPAASSTSSPSAPRSSTAPGTPTTITATTVMITNPVSGSCTTGLGRAGGAGTGPRRTNAPTGVPTGARSGGFGAGFGGFVVGKVTAVSGTAISVQATDRQTNQPVDDTVTVTSTTRYLETVPATSAAATVGQCAQAIGPADSTGAVAATRIAISSPVNGSCTTGFGGRGGFGRRPGSGSSTTGG